MRRTACKTLVTVAASLALVGASASTAAAEPRQSGLVNVNVSDVEIGDIASGNNVAVGVAAAIVANVCPNLSVGDVAVLASQVVRGDQSVTQQADCNGDADLDDIQITQAN